MKTLLAAVALSVASVGAHAESWFQIEAGIGATSSVKLGNGMYYSKGFSHDTPNGSYGGRVGLQLNIVDAPVRSWVPGVRAHLDYYNFGKVKWSATSPEDATYFSQKGEVGGYNPSTGTCLDNNCGDMRRFNSTGGIQAIALTAEAFWNVGSGWTVGVEAGPALYRTSWTSTATALTDGRFGPIGTQEVLTTPNVIKVGVLTGVSVGKHNFTARLNYLNAPVGDPSNQTPAGIKGVFMLSANYAF